MSNKFDDIAAELNKTPDELEQFLKGHDAVILPAELANEFVYVNKQVAAFLEKLGVLGGPIDSSLSEEVNEIISEQN